MPLSRPSRPRLNGTVIVHRFQPPQLKTVAAIRKGELTESLEVVASRIGLRSADNVDGHTVEFCLVDAQELTIMGKLIDKGVYYLSGGVPLSTEELDGVSGSASNVRSTGASVGRFLPPDSAVLWAFDPRVLLHRPFGNRSPETPYRLQRAIEALQQCERASDILPAQLLGPFALNIDGSMQLDLQPDPAKVSNVNCAEWIPARFARADELYSFHVPEVYHDFIERGSALTSLKSDVYCNENTSSVAARLSVGAVVDASASVLRGVESLRRDSTLAPTDAPLLAYCLVRPPGHHCTASQPSGFCLVNNVAIAAAQLREQHATTSPFSVPRVAILDFDVHFGEGTASFVESVDDPQTLLYLSIHRYDWQKFYPCDQRGDSAYVGRSKSTEAKFKGCICNVAVHTDANNPAFCEHVISDHLMNRVLEEIFLPRLEQFQPDVVLISMGFDAAYGDPLGKMAVEGGFAFVVARLKHWCTQEGRIAGLVVVLEGGYNPTSVAQGVVAVGLALSLPQADSSVQTVVQEHPPRVWADLRQRQERRLRDWQRAQKEREEEIGIEATMRSTDDGISDVSHPPQQIPDDSDLLVRHKRWCASLIKKVQQIHREALTTTV